MLQSSAAVAHAHKSTQVDDFENDGVAIPDYLEEYYWWAYVRPWAVWTFERDWMINLILWGFYNPLRALTLAMMEPDFSGRTLKISCCYGKLEHSLAEKVKQAGGHLDIIDVAPEQLKNSRRKLVDYLGDTVSHYHMNSNDLRLPDNSYDRAMIFFLPHEQPDEIRRKTFTEAFRVVKPGGHIYITEFSRSKWYHPLRYIWYPVLMVLEPFARAVWRNDIATFLPHGGVGCTIEKKEIFAKFYQCVKVTTPAK